MNSVKHTDFNINVDIFIDKMLVDGKDAKLIQDIWKSMTYMECDVRKRQEIVARYKMHLLELLKLPKIEQRTKEWYDARQTLITASDFAQALGEGKFGTQKQLIQKKCGFEEDHFDNSALALRWGTMFEDVACAIYAIRNKCHVHDFGLLRHPQIDYFGASPDGITDSGIMVEIKCPWKRKIDGTVPTQYFYQIQGQLDVCGLDECDYWECEFIDSEDPEDIKNSLGTFERGLILEDYDGNYTYSHVATQETWDTIEQWHACKCDMTKIKKLHYWALTKCSTVRVYRDEDFLKHKLVQLAEVWDKIKVYRADEELYNKEIRSAPKENPFKLKGFSFRNV